MYPEKQKDGNWIRKIVFNFPVSVNGQKITELPLKMKQWSKRSYNCKDCNAYKIPQRTQETYREFIDGRAIAWGGHSFELYFEEVDFDGFAEKLEKCAIEYVHPVKEHTWGQRVVRFYDPDHHIIEVGEAMQSVCARFLARGMTPEQAAERMDVPLKFVKACMR